MKKIGVLSLFNGRAEAIKELEELSDNHPEIIFIDDLRKRRSACPLELNAGIPPYSLTIFSPPCHSSGVNTGFALHYQIDVSEYMRITGKEYVE